MTSYTNEPMSKLSRLVNGKLAIVVIIAPLFIAILLDQPFDYQVLKPSFLRVRECFHGSYALA